MNLLPTEALRALRIWHLRQARKAHRNARGCATGARADRAEHYRRKAEFHDAAVVTLSAFFPPGQTAEADLAAWRVAHYAHRAGIHDELDD